MNYPITILDQPTPVTVQYIVRATVPVALQPRFSDSEKAPLYAAMDATDLAALRAGVVIERMELDTIPGKSLAQIKALIIAKQVAYQAEVSAASFNHWTYWGVQYNGSVWS
jgi:hypothetical protein